MIQHTNDNDEQIQHAPTADTNNEWTPWDVDNWVNSDERRFEANDAAFMHRQYDAIRAYYTL